MGLLKDIFKAAMAEATKPSTFRKGEEFEAFVKRLFIQEWYEILHETHSYSKNNEGYIKESLDPDFTFRDRTTGDVFAVECKYRQNLYFNEKGMQVYSWTKNFDQIERYRTFQKKKGIPVYLILGLGGKAESPERIFRMPLDEAKYPDIFISVLEKYERPIDLPFLYSKMPLF